MPDKESNNSLDQFKTNISLVDFARSSGYDIIKEKTSQNSVFLAGPNDNIVVAINSNGHFVFFVVDSQKDGGSIFDFMMHRNIGHNIPRCKQILSQYQNSIHDGSVSFDVTYNLKHVKTDIPAVQKAYNDMPRFSDHTFLLERGLSKSILKSSLVKNRIKNEYHTKDTITHVNTIFPMYGERNDKTQLLSYDIRNHEFSGAPPGSSKGFALWVSSFDATKPVNELFISESPVDSLSYADLTGKWKNENNIYVATAGQLTITHVELFNTLIAKHSPLKISFGFDNEISGERYASASLALMKPTPFLIDQDHIDNNVCLVHADILTKRLDKHTGEISFKLPSMERLYPIYGKSLDSDSVGESDSFAIQDIRDHFERLNIELNPEKKTFSVQIKPSIKGSLIKISFHNSFDNWKHITKSIHHLKYSDNEILSVKRSKHDDWNKDLMIKRGLLKEAEPRQEDEKKKPKSKGMSI